MFDRWREAQKLEEEYQKNNREHWNIEHNLEFWNNEFCCDCSKLAGVEIGCGDFGVFQFTDGIIGIDTLLIKKKNFIRASAEHLPFKHIQTVICHNVLDHVEEPKKVLEEIFELSDELIFSSNIFNPVVSALLNIFDNIHTFHFTKKDINSLFSPYDFTILHEKQISASHYYSQASSLKTKIKVLFGCFLGTKVVKFHIKILESKPAQTKQAENTLSEAVGSVKLFKENQP